VPIDTAILEWAAPQHHCLRLRSYYRSFARFVQVDRQDENIPGPTHPLSQDLWQYAFCDRLKKEPLSHYRQYFLSHPSGRLLSE
jgi:hypothetical protein